MPIARLTRRAEFVRMSAHARKAASPGLVLQVLRHRDGGDHAARIGFTVTKKVGNAVIRNRVRRRLREVARLRFASAPPTGFDLVLIGREGTIARPWSLLRRDLDDALGRAGDPLRATERRR